MQLPGIKNPAPTTATPIIICFFIIFQYKYALFILKYLGTALKKDVDNPMEPLPQKHENDKLRPVETMRVKRRRA